MNETIIDGEWLEVSFTDGGWVYTKNRFSFRPEFRVSRKGEASTVMRWDDLTLEEQKAVEHYLVC